MDTFGLNTMGRVDVLLFLLLLLVARTLKSFLRRNVTVLLGGAPTEGLLLAGGSRAVVFTRVLNCGWMPLFEGHIPLNDFSRFGISIRILKDPTILLTISCRVASRVEAGLH